ncbi:hypothetical protein PCANC_05002 [Puccinia coronata f. sp. avenae]|uniref:Uncharacterized protein n=1 Tax=Puccinia coronata f. sp. avenae TaxID=200324 RepID=A0A2N5TBF9_9BASI|nr:hypothetical protein PCANC_05002 [Puccinia coronata f. sp. avenae]PLW22812.1 hypothetical protein PCASD_12149 [Puccinia coronata f. sp. avenae]
MPELAIEQFRPENPDEAKPKKHTSFSHRVEEVNSGNEGPHAIKNQWLHSERNTQMLKLSGRLWLSRLIETKNGLFVSMMSHSKFSVSYRKQDMYDAK